MAYTPEPNDRPPGFVVQVIATACALTALFVFAPVIVRALFRHYGLA